MADASRRPLVWSEICRLFNVVESEMTEDQCRVLQDRINAMVDRHGREFVIRKIALHSE